MLIIGAMSATSSLVYNPATMPGMIILIPMTNHAGSHHRRRVLFPHLLLAKASRLGIVQPEADRLAGWGVLGVLEQGLTFLAVI